MLSLRLPIQVLYGVLNPLLLGVSTDFLIHYGLEDHSFPGTLGAGDSLVALQPPHWDLLISHLITAGDWDKHCIWSS